MAVQADGQLLLGGFFSSLQPNGSNIVARRYVARVKPDGTVDPGFNPSPDNSVWGLALQADGQVLLSGSFSTLQPNGASSPSRACVLPGFLTSRPCSPSPPLTPQH
jgi:trimeric autotransporter adhesin